MALGRSRPKAAKKPAGGPNYDSSPQPSTPSGLSATQVKEKYQKGHKPISQETYNFWLNFAYLANHQWLFFNTQTLRLDEIPRDPDRVQATVNKLLPASRTVVSKATSRELSFDVPPTAADDATVRSAQLAQSILVDVGREHDWETLREDAVWAAWRGGTSAVCIEWDAEAGNDLGEVTDNGKRVGTGDTVESVLNIAEFVVEPGSRNAETARWWIRAQALPPEQVQSTYRLADKPAPDATAGMSPLQQRLLAEQGTHRGEQPDLTLVLTYFERPNHLRPKGLICTVVGDDVVDGPFDWYFPWDDHLNIAVMRETHIDGRWTGDTVLTAARPVQALFNQSWSSIVEHMKLAGNARLAVPQSAVDTIQTLTDEPGELIAYPDGTTPPAWVSPPSMPAWWIEQPTKLAVEMDDILGVHPVSRGEAPANIQSGYGLSILAENDASPLGRLVKEQAIVWGKVATWTLQIYEKKVTEQRTSKVLVPGQAPETMPWSGKDLMGQTTAEIPIDGIMPRSRAAMHAFAEKAMQMGLITTLAQFARVADLPQQDDIIDAVSPDVGRARRENHALALGNPVEPRDYDNHSIHIQEHNDFRKSWRYETLYRDDPEAVRFMELHIQGHATLAAEAMGGRVADGMISPAMAMAPNAQGTLGLPVGPPPPGGPPGLPPAGMTPDGAALPAPAPAALETAPPQPQ